MTVGGTLFRLRRRNVWCWALGLMCLGSLSPFAIPTPACGQTAPVAHLLDLINQDRAAHRVGPASLNGGLSAIAQGQSNAIALAHSIFQNPAFPNLVSAANNA